MEMTEWIDGSVDDEFVRSSVEIYSDHTQATLEADAMSSTLSGIMDKYDRVRTDPRRPG